MPKETTIWFPYQKFYLFYDQDENDIVLVKRYIDPPRNDERKVIATAKREADAKFIVDSLNKAAME